MPWTQENQIAPLVGPKGPTGATGAKGDTGAAGAKGPTGSQGYGLQSWSGGGGRRMAMKSSTASQDFEWTPYRIYLGRGGAEIMAGALKFPSTGQQINVNSRGYLKPNASGSLNLQIKADTSGVYIFGTVGMAWSVSGKKDCGNSTYGWYDIYYSGSQLTGSDVRLKNVKGEVHDAIGALKKARPKRFKLKQDRGTKDEGREFTGYLATDFPAPDIQTPASPPTPENPAGVPASISLDARLAYVWKAVTQMSERAEALSTAGGA